MPKAAPYCFCSSPGLLASRNAISHRALDRAAGDDEADEFSKHSGSGSHRRKKTAWADSFEPCPHRFSLSEALNPRRRTWHLHGKTSLQAGYSGAAGLFRRQSSFGPMRGLQKAHSRNGPRRLKEPGDRPRVEPDLPAFSRAVNNLDVSKWYVIVPGLLTIFCERIE